MQVRKIRPLSSIVITLLLASFAPAQDRPNVAILELAGSGMAPSELEAFTNRLRAEVFETDRFTVVERGEMDAILKEQGFQQTGCTDASCAVEIGRLLNVQFMILGSIDKVGDIYTVNIRQVSIESSKVERNVKTDCLECSLNDVVLKVIRATARQLAGLDTLTHRTFRGKTNRMAAMASSFIPLCSLTVSVTGKHATLLLDGEKMAEGPTTKSYVGLPAGVHTLTVDREHWWGQETRKVTLIPGNPVIMKLHERNFDVGVTVRFERMRMHDKVGLRLIKVVGADTTVGPSITTDAIHNPMPFYSLNIGGRGKRNTFEGELYFGTSRTITKTVQLDASTSFTYDLSRLGVGAFFHYYRTVINFRNSLRVEPGLQIGAGNSTASFEGTLQPRGGAWRTAEPGSADTTYLDYSYEPHGLGLGGPCLRVCVGYKMIHVNLSYDMLFGPGFPGVYFSQRFGAGLLFLL